MEAESMHPLTSLAKDTVEAYIQGKHLPEIKELSPEMTEKAGVFVSIKKRGQLRGCIGTFEPVQSNVAAEIIQNAISSSTRDPRFNPITMEELPHLTYTVDVLSQPEQVANESQLDPKKYGVIVESGRKRGLLLPDLPGVDTVERQIDICRQKAGILRGEPIKLYRFEVRRYT